MKLLYLFVLLFGFNQITKSDEFFEDITYQILDNPPRLSYGVSVTISIMMMIMNLLTGFGFNNLALKYKKGYC